MLRGLLPIPGDTKLWQSAWSEFVPFLDYDVEIRRVTCSTNAIDSLNARFRRSLRSLPERPGRIEVPVLGDPITGTDRQRQSTMDDEVAEALNAFAVTFAGRITPSSNRP